MTTDKTAFEHFFKHFTKAIRDNHAALFIGAGMSVDAGLPTWSQLLKDPATELNLDIELEADFVSLAQFHFNKKKARTILNQLIVDAYGRDVRPTENHRLLSRLPIETVWTTNYDQLIEKGFREAGKQCDVRISEANFSSPVRGSDVTIYKMHGDISTPETAILTKDDYEVYNRQHEIFTNALKGDLVTKTFLFLGFSFSDPNIDYILSRIRLLMGQSPQHHYCIMRWPEKPNGRGKKRAAFDYEMRRLELRLADLERYGIHALMIDRFDQITDTLRTLNKLTHSQNIFVSGSAHVVEPMSPERLQNLCYLLGQRIIREGYNLVSGVGLGVGGNVLIGALEEFYKDPRNRLNDRILMRPFPQPSPSEADRAGIYTRYREDMLASVGYTIFIAGNKLDPESGEVDLSSGVMEEFSLSKELGKYPIPIGATGHAAKQIWDDVTSRTEDFFPGGKVKKHLAVLGDPSKSDEQLVEAVFEIIKATASPGGQII